MDKDQNQSLDQQKEEESIFSAPDVDFSLPGFQPPSMNLQAGDGFEEDGTSPIQLMKRKSESNDDRKINKKKKELPPKRKRSSRKAKEKGRKKMQEMAHHLFEETKPKSEPNHDFYLPKEKKTNVKDNHNHFSYTGYQYGENDNANFSGSDDSDDEGYTRRIHGKNLSFKNQKEVKNKRGKTHNTSGFSSNSGMNNSHLIGDQMKGSGHHFKRKKEQEKNGQNLIPTSDQYNKVLMAKMETQIKNQVGNKRFDMQVYTYYFDSNAPEKISNELESLKDSNLDEITKEMKTNLDKSKTKRVKKLVYEVKIGAGDKEKKFKGEIGADLALGTLDKESKKERKERKGEKEKKPRKVDLTESDLVTDLSEADDLFWGDSSYRNAFNSEDEDDGAMETEEVEGDTEDMEQED